MELEDLLKAMPFIVVDPKSDERHARALFSGPNSENIQLFKEGDEAIKEKETFYVGLAEDFLTARDFCRSAKEYMVLCGNERYCLKSVRDIQDGEIYLAKSIKIQYEEGSKFILESSSKNCLMFSV